MSTISEPACYVIVRRGTDVLFVMREHTGYMDGYYSLPAGRVEVGETYAEGAIREAKEEVGLQIHPKNLQHAFTAHRFSQGQQPEARTDVYFNVTDWSGEPQNMEPERHSAIAWLPFDNLPENVMDYQRAALLEIADGKSYGEHGWIEKTA